MSQQTLNSSLIYNLSPKAVSYTSCILTTNRDNNNNGIFIEREPLVKKKEKSSGDVQNSNPR